MTPLSSIPTAAPQLNIPASPAVDPALEQPAEGDSELRDVFDQFVGETFYRQMLASMRKTVGKSAYFDGGRAFADLESACEITAEDRGIDRAITLFHDLHTSFDDQRVVFVQTHDGSGGCLGNLAAARDLAHDVP